MSVMQNEKRIRAYRDALQVIVDIPCECPTAAMREECRRNAAVLEGFVNVLTWVLDGESDYDAAVDSVIVRAKGIKAQSN